ncbi:hypothetical protein A1D31_37800 [Bradyrhizobium liaoningense]|nr:hypothetical protein A1D31_37800 [Bradyrhizobium liaoningense]
MVANYLYRFRPLSRLLDRGELQNQEVFFASPDSLNDPMEGFRDVFWRGDTVIWRNLFRHYLLCVEWAYSFVSISGGKEHLSWRDIPIFDIIDRAETPMQKTRLEKLVGSFLEHDAIKNLIRQLSTSIHPIGRDELTAYLHPVHALALWFIQKNYSQNGLAKKIQSNAEVEAYLQRSMGQVHAMFDQTARLADEHDEPERVIRALFLAHRSMLDEVRFLHLYNNRAKPAEPNHAFLFFELPDQYAAQIEKLAYPDWYTACFMKECRDSSVWGHYGGSHTAACLIFNAGDDASKPHLKLKRIVGYGSDGPIIDYVAHPFQEVTYGDKYPSFDFFRSMGQLPMPLLSRTWYVDRSGTQSSYADDMFKDESAWRDRYWDTFNRSVTRKHGAWQYEQEQRLILTGGDYLDPARRITHYQFRDLMGIIFGIKTPTESKIAISEIIEEKCRAAGRTDFKFFQAFYHREKGSIEHQELGLLKFKF